MSEKQVKRIRAIRNLLSAAEPFTERGIDRTNLKCHVGLVPLDKCRHCNRIIKLQKAIDRLSLMVGMEKRAS